MTNEELRMKSEELGLIRDKTGDTEKRMALSQYHPRERVGCQ